MMRVNIQYYGFVLSALLLGQNAIAGDLVCDSPDAMALTNRGSIADTPCIVPDKKILIEGGYQYQQLIDMGSASSFSQIQATLGLPRDLEIFVNTPNYTTLHQQHLSGASATNVGGKTAIAATQTWMLSGQGYVTIPGGSKVFGSDGTGVTVNAIGLYNFNETSSLAVTLGGSSLTMPYDAGGDRYNSFNYSVSLGFSPVDKINLFAEILGQTKTSSVTGDGFNWDIGLLYAWNQQIVLDVEYIDRVWGAIGGVDHSIGAGVTVLLG